jgi:phosphoglycolate phosphatase-like HAD superfamily hydrolase
LPNALILDINAILHDAKDVSRFYFESIRNVYGTVLEGLDISKYDGTVQETVSQLLAGEGIDTGEKMQLFLDELPYAYYNVAGHDKISVSDGADSLIKELSTGSGVLLGIATPNLERIVANMLERASISAGSFRFAQYGGMGRERATIIGDAVEDAEALGAGRESALFVSSSPSMISAAKGLGITAIQLTNGAGAQKTQADHIIKRVRDLRRFLK